MQKSELHGTIDHIFRHLMPAYGLAERPEQVALSHRMLDGMLDRSISLCDAGTGIGKTYAYLVAGITYQMYLTAQRVPFRPITISTSSIALQNAILDVYIPFLSKLLLADGLIDQPVRGTIRKGKQHYVCDLRLARRIRSVELHKKNKAAANALTSLLVNLDMDQAKRLSGYDREHVCVPKTCDCRRRACRYLDFLKECETRQTMFQICNHNLLTADALRREAGGRPLLLDGCAVVIDEAHKLPETARQMLGRTLENGDITELVRALRSSGYLLAAESLQSMTKKLVSVLQQPPEAKPFSEYERLLIGPERTIDVIRRKLCDQLPRPVFQMLDKVAVTVRTLREDSKNKIRYAAESESGGTLLCATVTDLAGRFRALLWNQGKPFLLTSATLAVGDDFGKYRKKTGLVAGYQIQESVSVSPFQYKRNCLLYLPECPPRIRGRQYYGELTNQIVELLQVSCGHALVLFTSYAAMSAVTERLSKRHHRWQVFAMSRNSAYVVEQFKKTPGAVLLATGTAWEGIDFPGDCVSMLIIPRLPFPQPDAIKEKERESYATLQEYIQNAVIPEMQIKLRQGFGRAIRTETDTCAIAILDERAKKGGRYREAALCSLPDIPITGDVSDVRQFIETVKSKDYFLEGKVTS